MMVHSRSTKYIYCLCPVNDFITIDIGNLRFKSIPSCSKNNTKNTNTLSCCQKRETFDNNSMKESGCKM